MMKYSIRDFNKQFPDDDACLQWLVEFLYPSGIHCHKCDKVTKHHKVKSRKSYSCQECGHHVHPTAGTIYHKSSTPLKLWFYAVFLMSNTRCGISAKQLERELGVTYKTAWRMFKQIRTMLQEEPELSGTVEVDEAYIGGKGKGRQSMGKATKKKGVIAAVERGGSIKAHVATGTIKKDEIMSLITKTVEPGSTIYTDAATAYTKLADFGYNHSSIKHWRQIYVIGDLHTNTVEGFWANFKGGMKGVYKHCGGEYLQSYLNEYTFRYNRRKSDVAMFNHFLNQTSQLDWWIPYSERALH